jgi:hypothetical protein
MKQTILRGVGGLALVYLAGPMLLLAYGIQRWVAASTSDWRDGWASVRAFSVIFGLLYLISLVFLLLLLPPFAAQEHLLKPFWQHLSQVVAASIFPPDINHIMIRWPASAKLTKKYDVPYNWLLREVPSSVRGICVLL